MNVAAYPNPPGGESLPTSAAAAPAPGEVCPLCGASLGPEQDWCLRCGAAARTRLAASRRWRAPVIALAVVAALALAVLGAALVKLAGDSGSAARSVTRTGTAGGSTAQTGARLPSGRGSGTPTAPVGR